MINNKNPHNCEGLIFWAIYLSLISLVNHFNNDKRCRDFITEQRWGKVVVCPFCGCTHIAVVSMFI